MDQHILFAAINADGEFSMQQVRLKKKEVNVSPSDAKYGTRVGKVVMSPIEGDVQTVATDSLMAAKHIGWIVKNPDETYWWDTLSESEAETRSWWANQERAAKSEAMGFKVVPVAIEIQQ